MGEPTQISKQTGADAGAALTAEDLDLLPSNLEDEGKDDDQIWDEIDAEEAAAKGEAAEPANADESAADIAAAAAAEEANKKPDAGKDDAGKDDIWADASPEQRAAFDAAQTKSTGLQHSLDSEIGRSRTFRRQLSDVTRQLDTAAAKPPGKVGDGKPGDGKTKEWDELNTEFPEIAEPVGNRLDAIEANQAKQKKRDEVAADDASEVHGALVVEQTRLLATEHSDWLELATTPEFNGWLDDQPRQFRDAAVRNAKEIVDAKGAGEVIARYKASRSEGGNDPPGPGDDNQETEISLAAKRKRQLDASTGVRPTGPGAANQGIPEDGDEDEIWDAIDRQEANAAKA